MRVVILGASVAGSSTAISLLRNSEAEVTLIDRCFKRVSRCAGGVSKHLLSKSGFTIPRRLVQCELESVSIHGPGMETTLAFPARGYGCVLDRARFEAWLIEEASRLGAETCEWNVPSVEELSRYDYDYLVGADGLCSTVRRHLDLPLPPPADIHLGLQYEADWPGYPRGEVRLYFPLSEGYFWVFPAGGTRVKVGMGNPVYVRSPRALLEEAARAIGAPVPARVIAKLIPTAAPMKTCVFGNVALVGDAALQCDPLTGGGIANSLTAGNLLGQAIARGRLGEYDRAWRAHIGRRNAVRYRMKMFLSGLSRPELRRMFRGLRGLRPETYNVDRELAFGLLRLAARDFRLVVKGLVEVGLL